MNKYSFEYIHDEIEERINDIIEEFQTEHGIASGDIPFDISFKLESYVSSLAEAVRDAMDWQEYHCPTVRYEQTYAPDTDTTFIFKDTYMWKDLAKREVVGFYSGEPNAGRLAKYKDFGTVAEY